MAAGFRGVYVCAEYDGLPTKVSARCIGLLWDWVCVASCVLGAWMVPVHGGFGLWFRGLASGGMGQVCCEHEKGIWWMPWRQEAMKDVARCEKPGGAASRL